MNSIDRLIERIDELRNPTVVGLDPTPDLVPSPIMEKYMGEYGKIPRAIAAAFFNYNRIIIDAITDIVPCVKPQIAMYERFGVDGVSAYIATCEYASSKGLLVIGDVKRGDISSTAEAYAAHIAGADIFGERLDLWHEDFITVNPYLGSDGITPFTDACAETGKGIFVLVKTSNPSSAEIQDVDTEAEPSESTFKKKSIFSDVARAAIGVRSAPLYEQVARYVSLWGKSLIGDSGYSSVGAVVGATHSEVGATLRRLFPKMFFLVPGYGAQGAGAEDVKKFFDADGHGCIVNSSRGIIGAWAKSARGADGANGMNYSEAVNLLAETSRTAAIRMREELARIL
jgi:orotidine-5'-phosphate decarboxylase